MQLVVLSQEIFPVVVTVWGSNCGMRVESLGLIVVENYTLVMIKLDEQYRALDLVEERLMIAERAEPVAAGPITDPPREDRSTPQERPVSHAT
jgi:hypothetical protein